MSLMMLSTAVLLIRKAGSAPARIQIQAKTPQAIILLTVLPQLSLMTGCKMVIEKGEKKKLTLDTI